MVVCKIELYPGGDSSKAQPLGVILIDNDGTGDLEVGNYNVNLSHSGTYWGKPGFWKTGRCSYRRNLSPYHLIAKALAACGIK